MAYLFEWLTLSLRKDNWIIIKIAFLEDEYWVNFYLSRAKLKAILITDWFIFPASELLAHEFNIL